MFGLAILDVAIGLVFIYAFLSLIASSVWEGIEAQFKFKAKLLHDAIQELLAIPRAGVPGIPAESLYKHPAISALFKGAYTARARNLPSYIPASNFALALIDLAARGGNPAPDTPVTVASLRSRLTPGDGGAMDALSTFAAASGDDLGKLQSDVEAWFNSSMDRVTGWYRRKAQCGLFFIATGIVVAMNVNTLTIVDHLSKSDAARDVLVAQAEAYSKLSAPTLLPQAEIDKLALPIGFERFKGELSRVCGTGDCAAIAGVWLHAVFGWLATVLAVCLGAPFWFELLNKLVALRGSLKPAAVAPAAPPASAPATPAAPAAAPPPNRLGFMPAPTAPTGSPSGHDHTDTPETDTCCVTTDVPTPDEALPAAKGGVA